MINKISLLTILSFSLLSLTLVPVFGASSVDLYSCGKSDGEIYRLDISDGQITDDHEPIVLDANGSAFSSLDKCLALATDPTDGQMYMIARDNVGSDRYLATLDPVTGAGTIVGEFTENSFSFYPQHIGFDITGQMWAIETRDEDYGTVHSVDKTTGVVSVGEVCQMPEHSSDFWGGLTLNLDDEKMYYLNGDDAPDPYYLVEMDTTQSDCDGGSPVELTGYGALAYDYPQAITYDTTTSKFIVRGYYEVDHDLYSFTTNGIASSIGDETTTDMRGLAFSLSINEKPEITLTGASTVLFEVGDTYTELGATCLDFEDGVISPVDIDDSAVDTGTIGIYQVVYECTDSVPQTTQEFRTVEVGAVSGVDLFHADVICLTEQLFDFSGLLPFLEICPIDGADISAPVITITGDAVIQLVVGDTYTELGATAIDDIDGDLTGSIIATSDVNTSVAGVYFVNYDVQDSNGNDAVTQIRTVIVASAGSSGGGGSGSGFGQGSSVGDVGSGAGSGSGEGSGDAELDDLSEDQIEELLEQLAPTQMPTIIQEIIGTFFEFEVIDKTHDDLTTNSFLTDEGLGIRWSSGDDIIVTSVVTAQSPFDFTFESLPIIKEGSNSAISENSVIYNLNVPNQECGVQFDFDCVEDIRYSVPVTVSALINGTDVEATGTILVDLTVEDLNPILIILFFTLAIPIVAGVIHKMRGGHNPSNVKDLLH